MRLRLVVEYDGADFAGWQKQKGRRTVQSELEAAVGRITQEPARVVGSGRTDAGVHATGQVAHFDSQQVGPVTGLRRALNAVLPRDVAVVDVATVPATFHARHSATSRTYRYRLLLREVRSPLARRRTWHVSGPLDQDAMSEAAAALVGSHDFRAFGRALTPDGPTVRQVLRAALVPGAGTLAVELEANAFLRHQVRRTVGVLVEVGRGRLTMADVHGMLAGDVPARGPRRAPPQGLCLEAVTYPPEFDEAEGQTT